MFFFLSPVPPRRRFYSNHIFHPVRQTKFSMSEIPYFVHIMKVSDSVFCRDSSGNNNHHHVNKTNIIIIIVIIIIIIIISIIIVVVIIIITIIMIIVLLLSSP
jgi:hypothetical protein